MSPLDAPCENDGDPMTLDRCDGAGTCVGGEDYCSLFSCGKALPTNQTSCFDDEVSYISCPALPCDEDGGPDFCGQDAQYRDPDLARSFIESTVENDVVVEDSITGLVWQKEIASTGVARQDDAIAYCEASTYAGRTDWRLPDIHELASLVDFGAARPASDFPGMPGSIFWSSSRESYLVRPLLYPEPRPTETIELIRVVDFNYGNENGFPFFPPDGNDTYDAAARCVRGGPYYQSGVSRFYPTGETGQQTLLDRATGLVWEWRWEALSLTWKEALSYCEGLVHGNASDWRLPNINELIYLASGSSHLPDATAATGHSPFGSRSWSSSSGAGALGAWFFHGFCQGITSGQDSCVNTWRLFNLDDKSSPNNAFCVRDPR
jgi:hypothetical protein